MKILKQSEDRLLNRKIIEYEAEYSGATPKKEEIKRDIMKELKVDMELIIVKHIYPAYGERKGKVIVYVYDNADNLKRVERIKEAKADEGKKDAEIEKSAEKSVEEGKSGEEASN